MTIVTKEAPRQEREAFETKAKEQIKTAIENPNEFMF